MQVRGVRISDNFTDVINVKLLRRGAARALLPLIPFLGLPPISSSPYRAAGETTPQAAIISRARDKRRDLHVRLRDLSCSSHLQISLRNWSTLGQRDFFHTVMIFI